MTDKSPQGRFSGLRSGFRSEWLRSARPVAGSNSWKARDLIQIWIQTW